MRYFWNLVTGDLVQTDNEMVIVALLADGYIEISRERYMEIGKIILEKG